MLCFVSPGLRPPPLPTQNTQAARFALDQAAWMLCFVSPALAGSSFTYAEHPGSLICAGSGCPDALLRVPRPSASSFTYAEHPGNLIPVIGYSSSSSKNHVDTSEQQGGGTCQSEM